MNIWKFYFSGILYGIFREAEENDDCQDGAGLQYRYQNPFTNTLEDWNPYGPKEDAFYKELSKRSLLSFFGDRREYEAHINREEPHFDTTGREEYTRRADGSYIQRNIKFPKDLFHRDGMIYAVLMAGRDYTSVLVREGFEDLTILNKWQDDRIWGICPRTTVMIPTRDGESLATDIYLPDGKEGPHPTVLIRTPYGKSDGCIQYYRFVQRGYGVVIQDTRGREDSTGEWLPNYYEVEDGDDTLNWIAAQPFSDGQVAMTGGSYLGFVQWAAAASGNPHLKAILSSVCAGSPFVDLPRRGGCFCSGSMAWNFAMTMQRFCGELMVRDDWDEVLNIRPIKDMPLKALGRSIPFLDKWMAHPHYDDFWRRANWKERSTGHVVPALIMSGWFDDNGMGTTEALELVREYYPSGTWKAVLGPWMHSGNANYDLHGIYMGENALRYDMDLLCFQWLDHFLNGVENGIEMTAPVEYYTLGENRWKEGVSWPVPQSKSVPWYLTGQTAGGNGGGLTPGNGYGQNGGSDSYSFDPRNPAAHIIDMSENELEVPENYTTEELRPDILSYSTPVLSENITVTGDVTAVLYLSSDCPDTDLFIRITDVDESGNSIKLADGVLDVRYRNGFENPEFMEPGQIYEIKIRTTKISNTFLKGHRLRFTVTSGAKNFIFPNSNTEGGYDSQDMKVAHNTIHWGKDYTSRILLPIETR